MFTVCGSAHNSGCVVDGISAMAAYSVWPTEIMASIVCTLCMCEFVTRANIL